LSESSFGSLVQYTAQRKSQAPHGRQRLRPLCVLRCVHDSGIGRVLWCVSLRLTTLRWAAELWLSGSCYSLLALVLVSLCRSACWAAGHLPPPLFSGEGAAILFCPHWLAMICELPVAQNLALAHTHRPLAVLVGSHGLFPPLSGCSWRFLVCMDALCCGATVLAFQVRAYLVGLWLPHRRRGRV